MIGTAAQHQDILASLLALIRTPEQLAENIEVLHKKITDAEEATRIAREEQTKAKSLVLEAAKVKSDAEEMRLEVEHHGALVKDQADKLDYYKTELDDHATHILKCEHEHKTASKILDTRETQLKVAQAAIDERGRSIEKRHDERQAKLDAREDNIAQRETAVLEAEKVLRNKVDKLKQLAG